MACNCGKCGHEICTYRVPIFSNLSSEEMIEVTKLIVHKNYEKGENIFLEQNELDSLIIINKGKVKAYKYTAEGKEQILYIFSQGDFLGENNLLKNTKASYNVEVLEKTYICTIKKEDFQKLIIEKPKIALKVIEELSRRIERLENSVQNMGTKNSEIRVNLVLLEFIERYGIHSNEGIVINLPLSREGIANYIGVTRETVSRKLSLLYDEEIIDIIGNKKIIILNKEALEDSIK
ncbi:MAG: Crp/Fnr family transcriptional regulator [Clostridiaceae bacterium]